MNAAARRAPRSRRRWWGPLLLVLLAAGCATAPTGPAPRHCGPPSFPYQQGWFGGDAAYSVMLGDDRVLWLFGDSFVGPASATRRSEARFVHNSLAVAECRPDGHWRIHYAWGRGPDGAPRAFFAPDRPDRYWWLFDGFLYREQLFLGLLVVEPSPPRGPFQLPFRFAGTRLARVENPAAAPESWRWQVLPLSDDPTALPTSALVVDGDHLYLFTALDRDDGAHWPRALARLPLAALDGPAEALPGALRYLARDGAWRPWPVGDDARIVMDDDATEMSVAFHPEIARWVAVYSSPVPDPHTGRAPDAVLLRTAPALTGPWSEPTAVYRIPELDPTRASRDPNTFCYAAKEHRALAHPGRLLFTYVCNLYTPAGQDPWAVLDRLGRSPQLYRPRAVSIPLPAAGEAPD